MGIADYVKYNFGRVENIFSGAMFVV